MPRTKKVNQEALAVVPTAEVASTQPVLSPEEIAAVLALRSQTATAVVQSNGSAEAKLTVDQLAEAMGRALVSIKPFEKKTIITRKKMNPWMPTDGSPKILTLKRPMYQHGVEIDPKFTKNETCLLLDKIRSGKYCGGFITVTKRKNGGLDIDYPIRTAAQRLKLSSQFGITSFHGLLQRLLDERADPAKYKQAGDDELDD